MKGWDPDVQLAIEQAYQSGWREALESRDGPPAADRSVSPQANKETGECRCDENASIVWCPQHGYVTVSEPTNNEAEWRYVAARLCEALKERHKGQAPFAVKAMTEALALYEKLRAILAGESAGDVPADERCVCGHLRTSHDGACLGWHHDDNRRCECVGFITTRVPADTHPTGLTDDTKRTMILVSVGQQVRARLEGQPEGHPTMTDREFLSHILRLVRAVLPALDAYTDGPVGSASADCEHRMRLDPKTGDYVCLDCDHEIRGSRLNVLTGPVDFDYDPNDEPRGTLVPAVSAEADLGGGPGDDEPVDTAAPTPSSGPPSGEVKRLRDALLSSWGDAYLAGLGDLPLGRAIVNIVNVASDALGRDTVAYLMAKERARYADRAVRDGEQT